MDQQRKYQIFGLREVEGWLEPYSAEFIGAIAAVQRKNQWRGALGEIGVHHGKLFILLRLNAATGESQFAIDVFENQQLNVDGSGSGDREIFLRNVRRWCGSTDGIAIISKSSLEVSPKEILDAVGLVRLASIDGGHTEECTLNDLNLIERALADYGVAIIDDYFNPDWPGVSSGVAKYLTALSPVLHPFAISPNKIYFAREGFVAKYQSELNAHYKPSKRSTLFGNMIDIYNNPTPKRTVVRSVKHMINKSPLGPYLRAAKASIFRR